MESSFNTMHARRSQRPVEIVSFEHAATSADGSFPQRLTLGSILHASRGKRGIVLADQKPDVSSRSLSR
jgi:hypothetical protein